MRPTPGSQTHAGPVALRRRPVGAIHMDGGHEVYGGLGMYGGGGHVPRQRL